MDNREINSELRKKAISLGLCNEWQNNWQNDWTEDKMIAKYKEGVDFCLANNYPSNEFIKHNFSQKALRSGGLLIDEKYSVDNRRTFVVRGRSEITARYNGDCLGVAYVADNSTLNITARNRSHVIVHILGNAHVNASQYDNATLMLIRHSHECSYTAEGRVAVKTELDWLK